MCARRLGNILFYFLAENFSGSKDTEPYKTDVSFLCQYNIVDEKAMLRNWYNQIPPPAPNMEWERNKGGLDDIK